METSKLIPFVRNNLEILFIGLNPAKGSNENGHYFSVKQSFWSQLYRSGLITEEIDKLTADEIVFGSTMVNFINWNYGITDLITGMAESDSRKINPTKEDCYRLEHQIRKFQPTSAVILHNKVLNKLLKYLSLTPPEANSGNLGAIIPGIKTAFFNIAFPHGNTITDSSKIDRYIELKRHILALKHMENE